MGTERIAIQSMDDWMGDKNRQSRQQARRRQVTSAADLLGGGFGPTATPIQDWNDDLVTFNGFFYSVQGLSLNSPDAGEGWAGIVTAEADREFGIQEVWSSHSGTPPRRYTRRWQTVGGIRSYTAWIGQSEWQSTGITVVGGSCSIVEADWRTEGRMVFVDAKITTITVFVANATSGELPNTPMLQVPDEIIPTNGPSIGQPLAPGTNGPMVSWVMTSLGQLMICATVPNLTIAAGTLLSVGGAYSL